MVPQQNHQRGGRTQDQDSPERGKTVDRIEDRVAQPGQKEIQGRHGQEM